MEDLRFGVVSQNQRAGGGDARDEEAAEDLFKRLPDELIISYIFDKISEAESLCMCSLVSKRFSSLVFQTKTVSVKFPHPHQPIPTKIPRSCSPVKYVGELVTKFLVKFTSLKILHVEIDCFGVPSSGIFMTSTTTSITNNKPVVKWKLDLRSGAFLMLFARSLDDEDEQIVDENIGADVVQLITTSFPYHLHDANFRFFTMKKMFPILSKSLEYVVVTDSNKQGGIVLDGSELLDTKMFNQFDADFLDGNGGVKYWHEPVLKLPLSGSVMKRVTLFIYKDSGGSDSKEDDISTAKEAFEGKEEKVHVEAAMELLKKEKVSQEGFVLAGYL